MKWITIAHVQPDWYVLAQGSGRPGGLLVRWRGRLLPFQPCEFYDWWGLLGVLELRLAKARLQLVTLACPWPRETDFYGKIKLRALVVRLAPPRRGGAK